MVQGGFLGGWPRVGPHIGKELEEQRGGSDLETGKRDGGNSHVCLPACPMEGLPPPHIGRQSLLSLHLPFWETEAQRCKDMGQVTQAVEGRSQARNPESGKKLGPPGLAWAPVRILRRGQGTRRSCGDPGLGRRLQSRDLTDEGQRAGVSTAKWASGSGSIPTSALPHPL